jgi:hypothetical protein
MKTTVELPEPLLQSARQYAAQRGMTFKDVLIEALDLLMFTGESDPARPGWEALFGQFAGDEGAADVQRIVDQEFSHVDQEDWN